MKPADIKINHALFESCVYRGINSGPIVACFRLQHYIKPPVQVVDTHKRITAFIKSQGEINLKALEKWGGSTRIHSPSSKMEYHPLAAPHIQGNGMIDQTLSKQFIDAVEHAGYTILDSWDNNSNSGNGFSVLFEETVKP